MFDLGKTSYPKARKAHLCDECGCTIQPGETYARFEGVDAGVFSTTKACNECDDLANKLYDRGFDDDDCLPYLPEVDDWPGIRHDWPELEPLVDAYQTRTGRLS